MLFRKAIEADLDSVIKIYEEIHFAEESGKTTIGWVRGIYPTEKTAEEALGRGDLFVAEADGVIVGAAIINQQQPEAYHVATDAHDAAMGIKHQRGHQPAEHVHGP